MGDRGEITAFTVVESLTGWWELAGLDAAVSETSVNWLAEKAPSNAPHTAYKNVCHARNTFCVHYSVFRLAGRHFVFT